MTDVTFMGLGLMGAALAGTAIRAGYDVVVWNRSEEKARPLVDAGARYIPDAADAVAESPLIVVCVSDYDASDSFLRTEECIAALKGRVLVQLTTGSAQLARSAHAWAEAAGALYLDGGVLCYPSDIGEQRAAFVISGDEEGFRRAEPVLRTLAPALVYLGDDPANASAMDAALMSATFGVIFGLLNGAAVCEASGIPIRQFVELVGPILAMDVETAGESAIKYADDRLDDAEAQLVTWIDAIEPMISMMKDAGYSAEIPEFMKAMMERTVARGWGEQDIGAVMKLLKPGQG